MQRLPNSFMTLAELYLGIRATERARIIFDGQAGLSGDKLLETRKGRKAPPRSGSSNLAKMPGQEGRNTMLDIALAINARTTLLFNSQQDRSHSTQGPGGGSWRRGSAPVPSLLTGSPWTKGLASALNRLKKYGERHSGGIVEDGRGVDPQTLGRA